MEIFGYCNCAFFNTHAEGDVTWYDSAAERDAALSALRDRATDQGLSRTASIAGIYPLNYEVDLEAGDNIWLDVLIERSRSGLTHGRHAWGSV
jgi:hypothetical protein